MDWSVRVPCPMHLNVDYHEARKTYNMSSLVSENIPLHITLNVVMKRQNGKTEVMVNNHKNECVPTRGI